MSVEGNKAILHRVIEEAFNKGDLSVAKDGIAASYILRGPLGEFKGVDGFKQMVTMMRAAFPDLRVTIDDVVAEGNKVAARLTGGGTFKNEMMGIPPTGKNVTFTEAVFIRFEEGKEVEVLGYADRLVIYQQLGVSPPGKQ